MPIQAEINNFFLLFSFWIFIIGACVGSFLNVCIWRIPRGLSIVNPPSSCPLCGHIIRWYENIPILSWIILGGKCSSCKNKISIRYIFVELFCAIIYMLIWVKVYYTDGNIFSLLRYLVIAALAISTFFIDMKHFIIPDITTYPVMIYGIILSLFFPVSFGLRSTRDAFLFSAGGFLFSLIFLSISAIAGKKIFKKDALGWGDVKYMAAVGTLLGFPGAFFVLLLGSILGTLFGLFFVVIYKGKNLKTAIAFGPFLAVATLVWIFFGEKLLKMYFYISEILRGHIVLG